MPISTAASSNAIVSATRSPDAPTLGFSMPTWVLSIMAHGCLLVSFAMLTWTTAPPRAEREFTVGIVVKHETPDGPTFESETEKFESNVAPEKSPQFVPDALPNAAVQATASLPEIDMSAIGVGGSMLSGSSNLLSIPDGGVGASGISARTQFFGATVWGSKFVYAIDCSASMSTKSALDAAKREFLESLAKLPPTVQFQAVFYNLRMSMLPIDGGRKLLYATEQTKRLARRHLDTVVPDGGTEHKPPLRAAIDLGADVIFFLTDADAMSPADVAEVTAYNQQRAKATIHAIEFGIGPDLNEKTLLRDLATQNQGTYRYVDLSSLEPTGSKSR